MVESLTSQNIRTVYLVEDHELYALGLQRMIEDSPDFRWVGHSDGVLPAVAAYPVIRPDVMLVDLQLKGESGLSLIRSLRAYGEDPLIAVITSHHDPRLVADCERAGANAFILKDEPLECVLAKMRRMEKGQWEPPGRGVFNRRLKEVEANDFAAIWTMLSPREIECMKLLAEDLQQVEVAERLHISLNTLKNHRKNIYKKLGFKTKTDLVLFCRERGLL